MSDILSVEEKLRKRCRAPNENITQVTHRAIFLLYILFILFLFSKDDIWSIVANIVPTSSSTWPAMSA